MARRLVSPLAAVLALIGFAACAQDNTPVGPTADPAVPENSAPVGLPGATSGPRVLVDASRDGGVWWYPQVAPFSASANHQGKTLADAIRAQGFTVEELPRPNPITPDLLRGYDLVVRAGAFGTYTTSEVSAYRDYVNNGGKLLLLADHMLYAPRDNIAAAFGVEFAGITRGENVINTFAPHAITENVSLVPYMVGSGIVAQPAGATIVGRLSSDSYLDLNKNGIKDSSDVAAPAVLGVMSAGTGRIVFCGDTNLWEQVPQPLVKNVFAWFKP